MTSVSELCLFKFILLGESGVGKTSTYVRWKEGTFEPDTRYCVGLEFASRSLSVGPEQETVRIQLWDTAGQERYGTFSKLYFRGAAVVVLVMDATKVGALEKAERWLTLARECAPPDVIVMLLSNKSDLFGSQQRAVTRSDVDAFAAQHQLVHVETSAKTGDGIEQAFELGLSLAYAARCPPNTHAETSNVTLQPQAQPRTTTTCWC
jgi:small GTP-binding protein